MFTSMQRSDKPSIYKYSIHSPAGGSHEIEPGGGPHRLFLYAPTARLLKKSRNGCRVVNEKPSTKEIGIGTVAGFALKRLTHKVEFRIGFQNVTWLIETERPKKDSDCHGCFSHSAALSRDRGNILI